jgi:hypothetical protein
LPGKDYRTVEGPGPAFLEELDRRKHSEEVARITSDLEARLDSGRYEGVEDSLRRLEARGYRHVALAFEAQVAGCRGDLLKELPLRGEIATTIPDTPASLSSLRRYAELLDSFWLLDDAAAILRRVSAIAGRDSETEETLERVRRCSSLLSDGSGILMPNETFPLKPLAEAANAAGRPFLYRCLINRLEEQRFDGLRLAPAEFIEKYEEVRQRNEARSLPNAQLQMLSLVSHRDVTPPEPSVVLEINEKPPQGLEIAFCFHATAVGTVITPWIIFNAAQADSGASWADHNAACIAIIDHIASGTVSQSSLRTVHEACASVLGELVNAKRAARLKEARL